MLLLVNLHSSADSFVAPLPFGWEVTPWELSPVRREGAVAPLEK